MTKYINIIKKLDWKFIQILGILLFVLGFILSYYYSYNYDVGIWHIKSNSANIGEIYLENRNSTLLLSFIWIILSIVGVTFFFTSFLYDKYLSVKFDGDKGLHLLIKRWDMILLLVITAFAILMLSFGIYYLINPTNIAIKPPTDVLEEAKSKYNSVTIDNSNTIGPINLWVLSVGINFILITIGAIIFSVFYNFFIKRNNV